MERRFEDRLPIDLEVRVTEMRDGNRSGPGNLSDISKSGLSLKSPLQFTHGALVQLDMADSVLYGTVAYSEPEGPLFRTGIELVQVLLGGTALSLLLQVTLRGALPRTPGLEPSEIHFG